MNKEQRAPESILDAEFIASITEPLKKNSWVRRKLPGWGRLHIDRRLPFLCVYRRPVDRPDPGTRSLLLGEASYLLASGDPRQHPALQKLVQEIAAIQGEAFGAFLVLEIWAEEIPPGEPPAFHILAPAHNAPTALLESLENSLLGVRVNDKGLRVTLDYREERAPPGMPPLLDTPTRREMSCLLLGLGVPPLYRDADTGTLFPFELEQLRHDLGRALKKGFYAFAHGYTRHRPAHFFELGRHAMTSVVQETDAALAGISRDFDLLLHVTPVNVPDAWEAFRKGGYCHSPEFHYRPRPLQPARLKRQLYQIPLERIEDPTLFALFAAKRDELDRQITLIADRGTPRFLYGSQQIYGEVSDNVLKEAHRLLEQLLPGGRESSAPPLDAEAFAARARQALERYRENHSAFSACLEIREDISGLMVSRGNLLIGIDAQVPAERVEAAIAHEVGTHVLTWHNGSQQPFHQLQVGLAGYEALQEGLAVLAEYLVGGLDGKRLRLLAGRVAAVRCLVDGADFVETFRELNKGWDFSPRAAFLITMRVFRGGGFTKDAIYLRGLLELLDHLGKGGDLEPLLLGKFALEHLPFIEELQWRRILEPPPLCPHYLEMEGAKERLARLRQRPLLQTLIEESER